MKIGEIASRSGLPASTLRFYENEGLLPRPVRVSGKRVYAEESLDRIAFVHFAREAGFTIPEIRKLTGASKKSSPLSARLRTLAAAKIREIDEVIERAEMMKKLLSHALACSCLDPVECGSRIRKRSRGVSTSLPE